MKNINQYEIFKELYYQTIDRRERMFSRTNLIMTILIAIVSCLVYNFSILFDLWNKISCNQRMTLSIIFTINILIIIATIVIYIIFLIQYKNAHVSPDIIKQCFDNNIALQGQVSNKEIEQNIISNLSDVYIAAAMENDKSNMKKAKQQIIILIFVSSNFIFACIEFIVLHIIQI